MATKTKRSANEAESMFWKLLAVERDPERMREIHESGCADLGMWIRSNLLKVDSGRYALFSSAVKRLGDDGVRQLGVEQAIQNERRRAMGIPPCPDCGSFYVAPNKKTGPWRCRDCCREYGSKPIDELHPLRTENVQLRAALESANEHLAALGGDTRGLDVPTRAAERIEGTKQEGK